MGDISLNIIIDSETLKEIKWLYSFLEQEISFTQRAKYLSQENKEHQMEKLNRAINALRKLTRVTPGGILQTAEEKAGSRKDIRDLVQI